MYIYIASQRVCLETSAVHCVSSVLTWTSLEGTRSDRLD